MHPENTDESMDEMLRYFDALVCAADCVHATLAALFGLA
jgi:hypothetical protein